MADIIKFQEYVNSKEEEKKRIKMVSILSTRSKNIECLLRDINNSIGCSFMTKHFNEINQIVGKENIIDQDIIKVIIDSLNNYHNDICEQIKELNGDEIRTVTTC